MPATKFSASTCSAIVERVGVGVPLTEAARAESVDPRTVRQWLQRGRQEGRGAYFDFTIAVDAARAEAEAAASGPLTESEARQILEDQIRAGSLRAIELWFKTYGREEGEPPPTGIDALDAEPYMR